MPKKWCECICGFCTNLETIVVYADIHRIQVQQRSIALPFKIVTMLNNFASFIYSKSKYFTRKISFEGVFLFGFCIRLCSQKSPLISPRTAELITFFSFFFFNFVLLREKCQDNDCKQFIWFCCKLYLILKIARFNWNLGHQFCMPFCSHIQSG